MNETKEEIEERYLNYYESYLNNCRKESPLDFETWKIKIEEYNQFKRDYPELITYVTSFEVWLNKDNPMNPLSTRPTRNRKSDRKAAQLSEQYQKYWKSTTGTGRIPLDYKSWKKSRIDNQDQEPEIPSEIHEWLNEPVEIQQEYQEYCKRITDKGDKPFDFNHWFVCNQKQKQKTCAYNLYARYVTDEVKKWTPQNVNIPPLNYEDWYKTQDFDKIVETLTVIYDDGDRVNLGYFGENRTKLDVLSDFEIAKCQSFEFTFEEEKKEILDDDDFIVKKINQYCLVIQSKRNDIEIHVEHGKDTLIVSSHDDSSYTTFMAKKG